MNIYDFERENAPKLDLSRLYFLASQRILKRQRTIILTGAFLMAVAIILLGIFLYTYSFAASMISFGCAAYTLIGSGLICVSFICRGGRQMAEQ